MGGGGGVPLSFPASGRGGRGGLFFSVAVSSGLVSPRKRDSSLNRCVRETARTLPLRPQCLFAGFSEELPQEHLLGHAVCKLSRDRTPFLNEYSSRHSLSSPRGTAKRNTAVYYLNSKCVELCTYINTYIHTFFEVHTSTYIHTHIHTQIHYRGLFFCCLFVS